LEKILSLFIDSVPTIDSSVFSEAERIFRDSAQPVLLKIATKAAEDVREQLGGGAGLSISYELTNRAALDYALIQEAMSLRTDKKAVNKVVQEWESSEQKDDPSALREKLLVLEDENGKALFSMERAVRIAQSDAVQIYAGAKANALQANGYRKAVALPQAHAFCRCYVQPVTMNDGTKVIVWYTARDERVCTQEIEFPWGFVQGCRDLHRTIVSEGYAGQKWQGNTWSPKEKQQ
jgi:hypothetical protein